MEQHNAMNLIQRNTVPFPFIRSISTAVATKTASEFHSF